MAIHPLVKKPPDFVQFERDSIYQGIHERFEKQVRLYPERTALRTRDVAYSYGKANALANSIADEILSVSGKGLGQAAILLPNNADTIVTLLASLKAHKSYVPLDPRFPLERLRFMVEDAEPVVLLVDDQHMGLAEALTGDKIPVISISAIKSPGDAPDPKVSCDPLDRAYILYTSGSTGRPKGIQFLHRNLLHHIMCMTNNLFFSPSDRVTWLHSASFSASVVDVYSCLLNGGTLYPWDAKRQGFTCLADWLVQEKVTTFQWIPCAFRQFLRTVPVDTVFRDIRIVVMASEPLTLREVEWFRRFFPKGSNLVNQLGTSESYNYRLYPIDHEMKLTDVHVPGGYSVSSEREVLILDEDLRTLPPNRVGEIGVRSDYMSAGYWRDKTLTGKKFTRIDPDEPWVFLTGDLGKLEADGCLIHMGRKDFQVKIKGYRIEIAEVEHLLTAASGVSDALVWVAKNPLGEDQLVGYIVLNKQHAFNQPDVEEHLKAHLPDYMVPRQFVVLEALPTLDTGKINLAGLPNPFQASEAMTSSGFEGPGSVEHKIICLFKELLERDSIHIDSDFYRLGGDSLTTAILLSRVHQYFGIEVTIDDFASSPTPDRLVELIKC